ncbi:MAG TPA: hemolysin family protein [Ignavibacteriaceae bacterium]|nr:hemolysin family protein [Ignavibacteriaceae bacterium]
MISDLSLLIILILLSGFFSSTELAFIVSNKLKLEIKARKKNIAALNAVFFNKHSQNFYSTILLGNNVVGIAFASLSTIFFSSTFGWDDWTILIVSTLILLLFGELLPKYFAREIPDRLVLISSSPLRVFYFIFFPFIKILSAFSSLLFKSSEVKSGNINYIFDKEDIELLVKESEAAGMVEKKESDFISRVFDLGEQKVYEAMRPRTEIAGIEISLGIDEVLDIFIQSGYSKLPVFEDNLDNIKGVVYAYDLFSKPSSLQSIIRNIEFVPETKKSFDLLKEFLSRRFSIAIVIDEFGGTAGLVTMEDILEEVFGEIEDEYDTTEEICRKISNDSFLISGKVEVDYFNEKYGEIFPVGDYETVAGFIISKIGKIPIQGETIIIDGLIFLIARSTNSKIDLIKLTLPGDYITKNE